MLAEVVKQIKKKKIVNVYWIGKLNFIMEQYSRRNTLEINGIVENKHENVMDVVKTIGNSLSCPINDDVIDACHGVGQKGRDRPRGIVVKLTRRSVKEDLLQKRRVKRNLNT